MTDNEKLISIMEKLYDEWCEDRRTSFDVAASDDYYYHGASSFKDFIVEKLKKD